MNGQTDQLTKKYSKLVRFTVSQEDQRRKGLRIRQWGSQTDGLTHIAREMNGRLERQTDLEMGRELVTTWDSSLRLRIMF